MVDNMQDVVKSELVKIDNYTYTTGYQARNLIEGVEELIRGYHVEMPKDDRHSQTIKISWPNAVACKEWGNVHVCLIYPRRYDPWNPPNHRMPFGFPDDAYEWGQSGVLTVDVMYGMKFYIAIMADKPLPSGTTVVPVESDPYTETKAERFYGSPDGSTLIFQLQSSLTENPDEEYEYIFEAGVRIPL